MNATTSPLGEKLPQSHASFAATSSVGTCLAFPLRALRISKESDRAPPSTEIPPPET